MQLDLSKQEESEMQTDDCEDDPLASLGDNVRCLYLWA